MEEHIQREPKPMKPAKAIIDESKLTPPQRKILQLAREQGVPMTRKLEDLKPDFELTKEEADQYGRTIEKIREDSRKESANPFK